MSSGKSVYKKRTTKDLEKGVASWLLIVESPSKCAKIEHYLGPEYKCIASKGHFREIAGLKDIAIDRGFAPTFSFIADKVAHVKSMRFIIDQFPHSNIILATDDDREGEAIAWHICQVFGLPIETTPRIVFHEVTQPALVEAVANPRRINMPLVYAQQARQILDILVGFKVSPFLWKYVDRGFHSNTKKKGSEDNIGLSAGRCQTPALRLVYDNEMERQRGAGIEIRYRIVGHFFEQMTTAFELNRQFESVQDCRTFLEKSRDFRHALTVGKAKDCIHSAPKPFHTSRLLQVASQNLHYSPKKTMQLCQNLYQNGLITYMRTESQEYAAPFLETVGTFLMEEFGGDRRYLGPNIDSLGEKKDVPHEAIRVTDIRRRTLADDTPQQEATLYRLIWRNTVESCMSDAVYKNTALKITSPMEKSFYTHTVETPHFLGWKKLCSGKQQEDGANPLPFLASLSEKTKADVPYTYIETIASVQNHVAHYTEASLIHKLEELGIGRPSTFAFIVETIQSRGYVAVQDIEGRGVKCEEFILRSIRSIRSIQSVKSGMAGIIEPNSASGMAGIIEPNSASGMAGKDASLEPHISEKVFGKEKAKMKLQPMGYIVAEFLNTYFLDLFSYQYTGDMEADLDKILDTTSIQTVCQKCLDEIETLSKGVGEKASKKTFRLDEQHELLITSFGPSIRRIDGNNEITYIPVKQDFPLDMERLYSGGYSVQDLAAIQNECLGEYLGQDITVHLGKYGAYIKHGDKTHGIAELCKTKPLDQIVLDDVIFLLVPEEHVPCEGSGERKPPPPKNTAIIRHLTADMSMRTGKFGLYIYHKTDAMKKPDFISLKNFKQNPVTCDVGVLVEWASKH